MIFNFGTGVHDVNRPWRLQVQLNSIWYRYAVIRSCCSRYRCRCCFFSITLLRDLMNNFFCFSFFFYFCAWFARHAKIQSQCLDSMPFFLSVSTERQQKIDEKMTNNTNCKGIATTITEKSALATVTRVHKL